LFDQFGPAYTLVDAIGGSSGAERLLDEAELVGLPVSHLILDDPGLCQLYRHNLVLVRPDLHIAWSGTTVADGHVLEIANDHPERVQVTVPSDHHTLALHLGPAAGYSHSAYQITDLDAVAAGGSTC
jgi:hypothetical protein